MRNSGQQYISSRGKSVRERVLKPGCGEKCRYRCIQKIPQAEREQIFHNYWRLGDLALQRAFISAHVVSKAKQRGSKDSRKATSFEYHLISKNQQQRVCKVFFMNTLAITNKSVRTAVLKISDGMVLPDRRGKHVKTVVSDDDKAFVKQHIESFPRLPSHYCRKRSVKEYLSPQLNVQKMYSLYQEECVVKSRKPVSVHYYRHIFDSEYNIGFFKPKKDQCDFCTRYRNSSATEQSEMKERFEEHQENKAKVREMKEEDKKKAKMNPNHCSACFDLQQVLEIPYSEVSLLFYKRKLHVYNLSLYDFGTNDGHCYVWPQTVGRRGSSEIASMVYDFLKMKSENGAQSVVLYSDKCGGQNRNKYIISMYAYAIQRLNIESITHRFLESGHSQNENDSIHGVIETRGECP